ncbi:MAG: glycoside hydrolase family 16 protein [Flavobacteriaceae bacterium]
MTLYMISWLTLLFQGVQFLNMPMVEEKTKSYTHLIWSDEFNQDGAPTLEKWSYELGDGCPNLCGWGNQESQFYTNRPDNVRVRNGFLELTAKREVYQGANFTSARIKTQGKFEFTYGRVEVRAKLPQGKGVWPAIWMLGANINQVGWPSCGEIDIMEYVGNQPDVIHGSIHNDSSHGNTVNTRKLQTTNLTQEFHIYEVIWQEDKIVFQMDGNQFYTYQPGNKSPRNWPFDKDQYLLINLAMGGGFGGAIDPTFESGTLQVDYIRVYQ